MPSVLIADNDRAVNGLLRDVLARFGVPVLQAFDGREAMLLGRDADVRVVVCDLDMPGASGVEVLESFASLPAPPQALVVSGYLDSGVRARLQALPYVRGVLGKPFDLFAFATAVRELLPAAADGAVGG